MATMWEHSEKEVTLTKERVASGEIEPTDTWVLDF
jgi:hypothetical protein